MRSFGRVGCWLFRTSAEADRISAEADKLIANARTEANDILAKAKAEADELLAEARAEAQNTLARSRVEADERLQQLQEELAALRDQAEARMREIQVDTEAVWKERRDLLDNIRGMASGLVDLADEARRVRKFGHPAICRESCFSEDRANKPKSTAVSSPRPA